MNNTGISQNMLPGRYDLTSHKITEVIVTCNSVVNEKNKKKYTDTVKYDVYGFLREKKVIAFDTDSERKLAGDWKYTYDSLGNRLLETRKSTGQAIMNYFNYVYDSSRIKKQIWVYWIDMKLAFSKIYEVKYDGSGRINTELVEDGTEKLDSIFSFKFDTLNRLNQITCASDKDFKDTVKVVGYFYNPDGTTSSTVTITKAAKLVTQYTYDANRKLTRQASNDVITSYQYDKNGLLAMSEIVPKDKKDPKITYTYQYR
jgi:YD repeat-containing protein